MALKIERYEGRKGKNNLESKSSIVKKSNNTNLQKLVNQLYDKYTNTLVRVPVNYIKAIYDLQEALEDGISKTELNIVLRQTKDTLKEECSHLNSIIADVETLTQKCIADKNQALASYNEQERIKLDEILQHNFSWWHSIVNDFAVVGNEAIVATFVKHLEEQGLLERTRVLENQLFEDVVSKFSAKGYECDNIEELRNGCGIGDYITATYKSTLDIQIKEALNTVLHLPSNYRKGFKERCSEIYLAIATTLGKKVEKDFAYYLKSNFMLKSLAGFKSEATDCKLLLEEIEKALVSKQL